MNFFKKLLSITLGVLTFITGSTSVFAGGRDGIEYLPDGTKQIFISTEKIESIYKEYCEKEKDLEGKEYSIDGKKLLGVSLAAIFFSVVSSNYLGKKANATGNNAYLYLNIGTQVLIIVSAISAWIYPQINNHRLFHQKYGEFEEKKYSPKCCFVDYLFGDDHKHSKLIKSGICNYRKRLEDIVNFSIPNGYYQDGIVIIERPRGFKTEIVDAYGSNIYSQNEWINRCNNSFLKRSDE